jgi:hypothetical protein
LSLHPIGSAEENDEVLKGVLATGTIYSNEVDIPPSEKAFQAQSQGVTPGRIVELARERDNEEAQKVVIELLGVIGIMPVDILVPVLRVVQCLAIAIENLRD